MSRLRLVRAVGCVTLSCVAVGVPVAGASASEASIKAAIVSYNLKIVAAEGKVASALEEYEQTKDPTNVESAIAASVTVLKGLRGKVAHQPAGRTRVKKAKRKIEQGLESVIVAYEGLSGAFAEKGTSPEAASADAAKAIAAAKTGRKELLAGVKLLS
jgi:hypothetical protein